jgi:hypothetical protein
MGPQAPAVLRWGFCEPTKVTPRSERARLELAAELLAWHLTLPLKFVASAHQPLRDPRPSSLRFSPQARSLHSTASRQRPLLLTCS